MENTMWPRLTVKAEAFRDTAARHVISSASGAADAAMSDAD
jgi:hypothetical protein